MDNLSKKQRSYCMSQIKSKNTSPELIVRKIVFSMGYRYRLHDKSLPGKPDLVLKRHKKVIFVNGCFWHKHSCKSGRVVPKTNSAYWENKRNANKQRDKQNRRKLRKLGWKVLAIWECQIKNPFLVKERISKFLLD